MSDEEVELVFRGFLKLTYEQQQDLQFMIQAYYRRNNTERRQVKASYADFTTYMTETCPCCGQIIVKKVTDDPLTSSSTG